MGRQCGNILPVQFNPSAQVGQKAADGPQYGGFAATGRAQQTDEFFFFHMDTKVFDGVFIAVFFMQILNIQKHVFSPVLPT